MIGNQGYGGSYDGAITDNDTTGGGTAVLTLGSGLTINSSGQGQTNLGEAYNVYGYLNQADSIVNAGTINVTSGTLNIDPVSFTNSGAINVASGVLDIDPTNFTNTGTISVSNGATLDLDVNLADVSLAGISVAAGGTINIDGGVDNTGSVFTVPSGGGDVVLRGTVGGGTIVDPSGALTANGGTLSGVTYDGALNVSGASSSSLLFVSGG